MSAWSEVVTDRRNYTAVNQTYCGLIRAHPRLLTWPVKNSEKRRETRQELTPAIGLCRVYVRSPAALPRTLTPYLSAFDAFMVGLVRRNSTDPVLNSYRSEKCRQRGKM